MDLAHRFDFNSLGTRVSLGIREIPRIVANRLSRFDPLRKAAVHPAFRTGALLALAILLGSWAQGLSAQAGREAFEREHPPSLRAWEASLAPLGFHRETNPDRLQNALKNLPSRFEGDNGEIWISDDSAWIALLETPHPEQPPTIVCRECEKAPLGWKPAGRGWQAFDGILAALEKKPRQILAAHRRTEAAWADPRELRF